MWLTGSHLATSQRQLFITKQKKTWNEAESQSPGSTLKRASLHPGGANLQKTTGMARAVQRSHYRRVGGRVEAFAPPEGRRAQQRQHLNLF